MTYSYKENICHMQPQWYILLLSYIVWIYNWQSCNSCNCIVCSPFYAEPSFTFNDIIGFRRIYFQENVMMIVVFNVHVDCSVVICLYRDIPEMSGASLSNTKDINFSRMICKKYFSPVGSDEISYVFILSVLHYIYVIND